ADVTLPRGGECRFRIWLAIISATPCQATAALISLRLLQVQKKNRALAGRREPSARSKASTSSMLQAPGYSVPARERAGGWRTHARRPSANTCGGGVANLCAASSAGSHR